MKRILIVLILMIVTVWSCNIKNKDKQTVTEPENSIIGKWVRIGQTGPIAFNFKENGLIDADFGNDQKIDVVTNYEISGDTIKFTDKKGKCVKVLVNIKCIKLNIIYHLT